MTIAVHHPVAPSPPAGRAQQFRYQPYHHGHQEQAEMYLLDDRKSHADRRGMGLEELESFAAGFLYGGRSVGGERGRP